MKKREAICSRIPSNEEKVASLLQGPAHTQESSATSHMTRATRGVTLQYTSVGTKCGVPDTGQAYEFEQLILTQ